MDLQFLNLPNEIIELIKTFLKTPGVYSYRRMKCLTPYIKLFNKKKYYLMSQNLFSDETYFFLKNKK
jgi:hypothetical protein